MQNPSEKTLRKWNLELVELHKRVIITYLVSKGIPFKTRRKVIRLYDIYIDEDNIREYFYVPTRVLIIHLVTNNLKEVAKYIPHNPK